MYYSLFLFFDREFLAVILVTLLRMFFARYKLMNPEENYDAITRSLTDVSVSVSLRSPMRRPPLVLSRARVGRRLRSENYDAILRNNVT